MLHARSRPIEILSQSYSFISWHTILVVWLVFHILLQQVLFQDFMNIFVTFLNSASLRFRKSISCWDFYNYAVLYLVFTWSPYSWSPVEITWSLLFVEITHVHYFYVPWLIITSQWVMMLLRMSHCGITVGNDVARDIHCDITMGNDVAMFTYRITMQNDIAMNLFQIILYCCFTMKLFKL